ncbi:hypothetical protein Taro_001256 [Colocasia esculenta]|uniref:Uncharacterized protein n=1 Tax=Colocasia esculenta TaxID=4460 RepID=A0A843TD29_COLES|nr:hypothetical protein [Colocasia esculenta]
MRVHGFFVSRRRPWLAEDEYLHVKHEQSFNPLFSFFLFRNFLPKSSTLGPPLIGVFIGVYPHLREEERDLLRGESLRVDYPEGESLQVDYPESPPSERLLSLRWHHRPSASAVWDAAAGWRRHDLQASFDCKQRRPVGERRYPAREDPTPPPTGCSKLVNPEAIHGALRSFLDLPRIFDRILTSRGFRSYLDMYKGSCRYLTIPRLRAACQFPMWSALSHTQESARRFIEVAWVPLHRGCQGAKNPPQRVALVAEPPRRGWPCAGTPPLGVALHRNTPLRVS